MQFFTSLVIFSNAIERLSGDHTFRVHIDPFPHEKVEIQWRNLDLLQIQPSKQNTLFIRSFALLHGLHWFYEKTTVIRAFANFVFSAALYK